jgi:DNA-binding NarL/FixJ family response regulator
MKDKISILLADSHGTVRKQLRTRLSHEPEFDIVCEADNSADLIECGQLNSPDILLVDPIMRDGFGLQAVQRLATQLPGTVIVILTAFTDTATDMALRKMGVRHILTKDLDVQRLVDLLKSLKKMPDGDGTAASGLPVG